VTIKGPLRIHVSNRIALEIELASPADLIR
jgi:hypothetical protein